MFDKNKSVSIKDIAKLSGVSIATVSRIINQTGRFSKETEKRVNDYILEYGYVTNNSAKSLRISSSNTIGVILPNIKNDFFASIAFAIENYFSKLDYSVFVCNTSNNAEKEKAYFKKLESQGVDGIIVISGLDSLPNNITSRKIPIILVDRHPDNDMNLPVVRNDDRLGLYKATQLLIDKGCKNLVYIGANLVEYNKKERQEGFIECLKHNKIPYHNNIISLSTDKTPSYVEAEILLDRYLQDGHKIDGVCCASDEAAVGALYALKRNNLNVPNDVKLFGYDNSLLSRLVFPAISTIGRNPELIAETACVSLISIINKNDNYEKDHIFPVDLIERDSTK